MTKAYDIKELVAKLKARGLDIAEEAAKIVVEETLNWTEESCTISPTPYDDILKVIIPVIKPKIMTAIDKIDGQVG